MADFTDDVLHAGRTVVGTSSAVVLPGMAGNRRTLLIQNDGATDIYLGFGADAASVTATNAGVHLVAGAAYTDDGPGCYSGAVHAISSAGGGVVRAVAF